MYNNHFNYMLVVLWDIINLNRRAYCCDLHDYINVEADD